MGLTLHYRLTAADGLSARSAAAIVRRIHATASAWVEAGRIQKVFPISPDRAELDRWGGAWRMLPHPEMAGTSVGIHIPPAAGWIFPIALGEDCEPLWLGLCRYPPTIAVGRRRRATRLNARWQFAGSCKTQYASLHGWEHFMRCHVVAMDLLALGRASGLRVKINDEGGYWPRRNLATLRHRLDEMNGIVAAVAGAVKDATGDGGSAPVVAPIFAHPQFERLEAEGATRVGASLAAATKLITSLP